MQTWIILSRFHADNLESVLDQRFERVLVVGLENEFCVPDPENIVAYEVGYPTFLVNPFAWDYVRDDNFCPEASHDQAFDHFAFASGFFDLSLAFRRALLFELVALLHAALGDEEVIDAHHRHARLVPLAAFVLLAATAAHDAKRAPIAEREVRTVVLLDLFRRWKPGIPCDPGGLDVLVTLHIIGVDRRVFRNAVLDRSQLDISLDAFGASKFGSYGCFLRGRGRRAYWVTSCLPKLDSVRSAR